jgi:hypothetical protein
MNGPLDDIAETTPVTPFRTLVSLLSDIRPQSESIDLDSDWTELIAPERSEYRPASVGIARTARPPSNHWNRFPSKP